MVDQPTEQTSPAAPKPEQQPPKKSAPISATPLRDYWQRYRGLAFLACFGMQLVITLAILGSLWAAGVMAVDAVMLVCGLAIFVAATALNFILLNLLLAPFRELLLALVSTAGEPSVETPPNPNATRFARTGFTPVLQTVYELASADHSPKTAAALDSGVLEKALAQTQAGMVVLDHNHEIIFANRAAPICLDKDNKPILELIFEDSRDSLATWLQQAENTSVHAEKTWLRIPNKLVGEEGRRIFDVAAHYEKGSNAETVLVFYDLSDEYRPEDDDLDFIAFAAHELRGPITVIRGYLDVFSDELGAKMDSQQLELLQRLTVSANRLSGYINNILNASRYDRRHLQVHLVEDRVSDIYATIADDMQQRAHAQNRLLAVNIPTDLPTVAADRSSLSEVLGNLIDNAIKYSNEGGSVNVTARVENNFVIVRIEDHGIGMPGSVVANLFHKFYRSHRSRETVAGTGIGLYISKAIVESHGGTIGVKSVEGQGSVFEFSVPTYASVADKLVTSGGQNAQLISNGGGWINNHSMYRG